MKLDRRAVLHLLCWLSLTVASSGCSLMPDTRHQDVVHNPFPQIKRVAILPFFNQSSEPSIDSDVVAEGYYSALQAIPGFEVLPVGVAKAQWLQYTMENGEPRSGEDFQQLANQMGVEAIVVGAITDFDPYYPPRLAMTVHWYAANEGFHPIPAGYGLPWGTDAEKQIPRRIAREAEFELARSQLATQTPLMAGNPVPVSQNPTQQVAYHEELLPPVPGENGGATVMPPFEPSPAGEQTPPGEQAPGFERAPSSALIPPSAPVAPSAPTASQPEEPWLPEGPIVGEGFEPLVVGDGVTMEQFVPPLPSDWPDPTDLIPDPPAAQRPIAEINRKPVLSHTRLYRGDDTYFTNRLADYVETGDDARPGGWQGYLKRSDDFIRFCCHLHITEMLESRGGRDQSDLILRWPVSRY